MRKLFCPSGVGLSYSVAGNGPPLVLVHGSFSDHDSNWSLVTPHLADQFTLYAVARRGRGETEFTREHSLKDEAVDVATLIQSIGKPVFLLGHSYGAQVALNAALAVPGLVRKLVLYEPPWPDTVDDTAFKSLEAIAAAGDWDGFAETFFRNVVRVSGDELNGLRAPEVWNTIVSDAEASLADIRALRRYAFTPDQFRHLRIPVLLQIGSDSPRSLYVTDALAAALQDARIEELIGQAHEGMNTAPTLYAGSVVRHLCS